MSDTGRTIDAAHPVCVSVACRQYADTEKQLKAEAAKIDADMAKEAKREPGENVPPK
jgi:hypothetical protein